MHLLRPDPRSAELNSEGERPGNLCFNKPPGILMHSKVYEAWIYSILWKCGGLSGLQCTCNWDWIIGLKILNNIYLFLHIKCYKGIKFITWPLQYWSSEVTKANSMTLIHSHQSVSSHIHNTRIPIWVCLPFFPLFWVVTKWVHIPVHTLLCNLLFSLNKLWTSLQVSMYSSNIFSFRSCRIFQTMNTAYLIQSYPYW